MAAGASKAWAQLPAGYSWSLKAGWNGSVTSSSHQDEGVFSGVRGFYDFRNGFFGAGGEVRFGHEMDFGGVQKYLGVFQYSDSKTFKWPCYVNLYMARIFIWNRPPV
jgi:hypothetical protein